MAFSIQSTFFTYCLFYFLSNKVYYRYFMFIDIALGACFDAMSALPPIALAILRRILPSAPKR